MLLATKFLAPVPRQGYLRRERLYRCLDGACSTPVTVVCAPAGFVKSALLAGWLSELEAPWGWLSIDAQDNDGAGCGPTSSLPSSAWRAPSVADRSADAAHAHMAAALRTAAAVGMYQTVIKAGPGVA